MCARVQIAVPPSSLAHLTPSPPHSFARITASPTSQPRHPYSLAPRYPSARPPLLFPRPPSPWLAFIPLPAASRDFPRDAQALIGGLQRFGFAPETLLEDTDIGARNALLAVAIPPIRTDLAMREEFCAAASARVRAGLRASPILPSPVHVFGGERDRSFGREALAAWRAFAPADARGAPAFSCTLLPGSHFYLDATDGRSALLSRLSAILAKAVSTLPVSALVGGCVPPTHSVSYVHEMIESQAAATPKAVALVDPHSSRTYGQLVEESTRMGTWMVAHCAGPATVVALLAQHCPE